MIDNLTAEQIADQIGRLADKCDNIHAAGNLPLPADVHLPIVRTSLLDMRDELRAMYVQLTGENPWTP